MVVSTCVKATQGNRSVSNFVAHLEHIGSKIRVIQLAEMGEESDVFIKKATDQVLLSSLKSGLNGDARLAVLAANPAQFSLAVDIAVAAEASTKERGQSEGVFHIRKQPFRGTTNNFRGSRVYNSRGNWTGQGYNRGSFGRDQTHNQGSVGRGQSYNRELYGRGKGHYRGLSSRGQNINRTGRFINMTEGEETFFRE